MKKIIIALLILSSCSKPKDDVVVPDNTDKNKALLIGTWVYSARTISPAMDWDGNGSVETNIYPVMTACQKDFFIQFAATGGVIKLSCSNPNQAILWQLIDNGNTVKYTIASSTHSFQKIISINSTTLVTTSELQNPSGGVYTITNTYSKQ